MNEKENDSSMQPDVPDAETEKVPVEPVQNDGVTDIPGEAPKQETAATSPDEPGTSDEPTLPEKETAEADPAEETETPTETPAGTPAGTPGESPDMPPPPVTAYRWTYVDEVAHDRKDRRRTRRKGVLTYALIMTGAFAISLALLLAVLLGSPLSGSSGGTILRPGVDETDVPDDVALSGIERAKHSVVVIDVVTKGGGGSVGSGVVMTKDGYIATNHHVIENAEKIRVKFYDGRYETAELIGFSEIDDLAVIRVKRNDLHPAVFGVSKNCYVGETVYAIGTPAGPNYEWTTTRGIISYKDREVRIYNADRTLNKKMHLLQTDAEVNPGNSGGPLINAKGEVLGIVTLKLADGYEGINFAIPSDGAVEILQAIMKYGNADSINSSVSAGRPMLGIVGVYVEKDTYYLQIDNRIQKLTEEEAAEEKKKNPDKVIYAGESGIYVVSTVEGNDSSRKLQTGDIILSVDGVTASSMDQLMNVIDDHNIGDTVKLKVFRNGKTVNTDLKLSGKTDK